MGRGGAGFGRAIAPAGLAAGFAAPALASAGRACLGVFFLTAVALAFVFLGAARSAFLTVSAGFVAAGDVVHEHRHRRRGRQIVADRGDAAEGIGDVLRQADLRRRGDRIDPRRRAGQRLLLAADRGRVDEGAFLHDDRPAV